MIEGKASHLRTAHHRYQALPDAQLQRSLHRAAARGMQTIAKGAVQQPPTLRKPLFPAELMTDIDWCVREPASNAALSCILDDGLVSRINLDAILNGP